MIKGIGIDLIEVDRIEKAISRNDRFLERVFSTAELDYLKTRNYNKFTVSGLFASKEAVSKALGTGINGFDWKDIEICKDHLGKPMVLLKRYAQNVAESRGIRDIHISISHDKENAISIAVAEGTQQRYGAESDMMTELIRESLFKRKSESHKGTYGRVGVIAGSKGMSGAPFLSSSSAMRTGSGLVYTIVPSSISEVVEIKSVEAIVKSFDDLGRGGFIKENIEDIIAYAEMLDVIAIGPGLGVDEDRVELVSEILKNSRIPVVVDADGLNCIAKNKAVLLNRTYPTVLTPHEGEFERLLKDEGMHGDIKMNREKYSMDFAKKYNVILALKGPRTIVCDGKDIYVNSTGNPGMATAGSGDVLTGIVASLIGQGIGAFEATKIAVYLHGLSGDIAKCEKGEYGLIARDIIESIPYAIKKLEGDKDEFIEKSKTCVDRDKSR